MIKRLYTLFVICIALSCWFSVAGAQEPMVEIQAEPETPANPSVGDTLRYRAVIRNAGDVIGFRLTYSYSRDIAARWSVEHWDEDQSGTYKANTFESSTRLVGVSIRNIFILELPDVSAGTGEIRVTGTLRMHPRAAVNPGRTINVDVSFPITVSSPARVIPKPLPPPEPAIPVPPPEPLPIPAEDVVSIPDANLAAAVRKALDLGSNAIIIKQMMQRLTQLNAGESQIKNLTGLEHATQLMELSLYKNQIRDIKPLYRLESFKAIGSR